MNYAPTQHTNTLRDSARARGITDESSIKWIVNGTIFRRIYTYTGDSNSSLLPPIDVISVPSAKNVQGCMLEYQRLLEKHGKYHSIDTPSFFMRWAALARICAEACAVDKSNTTGRWSAVTAVYDVYCDPWKFAERFVSGDANTPLTASKDCCPVRYFVGHTYRTW